MEYLEYLIQLANLNHQRYTAATPLAIIMLGTLGFATTLWLLLDYDYMSKNTTIRLYVRGKDAQAVLDKLVERAKE